MALGGAVVATLACSSTTTTETEAGVADTASSGDISKTDTVSSDTTAVVDTRPPDDSIAMPYGAPPADGLLV